MKIQESDHLMSDYPYQDPTQNPYEPSGHYNANDGSYSAQPFTDYPAQSNLEYPPSSAYPQQQANYPPTYSQSMYPPLQMGYMPQASRDNGPGIASLVLGILSIIFCWLPLGGLVMAIVGLILANMGMKRLEGRGLAIAGLVLSIIGVAFSGCITGLFIAGTFHLHF